MKRYRQVALYLVVFLLAGCRGGKLYDGKAFGEWILLLKSKKGGEVQAAKQALSKIGRPAVGQLIRAMKRQGKAVKAAVRDILGALGKRQPAKFVADLISDNAHRREQGAWVLGLARANTAVPLLIKALKDESYFVRYAAVMALGLIGKGAAVAAPALIAGFKDNNLSFKEVVAASLAKLGKAAVPLLLKEIYKEPVLNRWHAVKALGHIGPEALAAIPALMKVMKETELRMRFAAVKSLGQIGPAAQAAIPEFLLLLKGRNLPLRRAAAEALGGMGPVAQAAIGALTAASKDKDPVLKKKALAALKRIGGK